MTLDSILIHLPERVSKAVISLNKPQITEIRLRAFSPISVTCAEGNVIFDEQGREVTAEKGLKLSDTELEETVNSLCRYSRYSYEEYIKEGFIPLEKGGRAGVCGSSFSPDGKTIRFTKITSVNIRLNSFLPQIASDTAKLMKENPFGVLVYSPPGHGKTTYLKSLIYLLSMGIYTKPYRVGVIDERFELGEGLCTKGLCDIISGASKDKAIELLTRTMSPEIIVCDEINKNESQAIINGCNSGTSFICSVHGKSVEEIKKRGFILPIIEANIFKYAVGIKKKNGNYQYELSTF